MPRRPTPPPPPPKVPATHAQLVEIYRHLPPIEQQIIQMSALIYEPVSRTTLLSCLQEAGVKDLQGKALTTQTLKPYVEDLLELRVLVQTAGRGPQCESQIREIATRDVIRANQLNKFIRAIAKQLPLEERWKGGPYNINSEDKFIREVRFAIYQGNQKQINRLFEDYYRYTYGNDKISFSEILLMVCNNPFDAEWLQTLPQELQTSAIAAIFSDATLLLTPVDKAFELLKQACAQPEPPAPVMYHIYLIEQFLLRGQLQEAEAALDRFTRLRTLNNLDGLWGWLSFVRGKDEEAIANFLSGLKFIRKNTGKRKEYYHSVNGVFFILALLRQGTAQALKDAVEYAGLGEKARGIYMETYALLGRLARLQQGEMSQKDIVLLTALTGGENAIDILVQSLCVYWLDKKEARETLPPSLETLLEQAETAGYQWIAMETAELLLKLQPRNADAKRLADLRAETGVPPLTQIIQRQEAWELALNALANLQKPASQTSTTRSEANLRLAWLLNYYGDGSFYLHPREQTLSAKGEWSKGRPVALKRLATKAATFSYLTPQDLQVCTHLESSYHGWGEASYEFGEGAIAALVGHPLVFWENSPTTRVEIVKGEPELRVTKGKDDQLILKFEPAIKNSKNLHIDKETPTRLKVIEITAEHRRIAEILGQRNKLEVPAAAKEKVLNAISAVSSIVTVHSDVGGGVQSAEEVPSDARPHVHLLPAGEGLKVAVLSRPFAQGGPYFRPGKGGETVIAEIDGKRLQTTRNLKEEKKLANGAIAALPTLSRYTPEDNEWLIADPQDCLELLLELQDLGEAVLIEWPEGEKLRVSHRADFKNFKLNIRSQNDWFDTTGELRLDDEQVLDIQRLMELLGGTPGRFVPLGNGEFVALTQEFRKRLDELRAFSEKSGKGLRVHPLAALTLEDWIDEVGDLKADKKWKQHIQRLKEMQTLEPELPSTLQAELRDYQLEGFQWLARLAHWGVGACLADDMGLGKTLQSLALILTRAPQGATLVIAPTSVCMNWISEAERFAPTLRVIQFGSGDRQKTLDNLKPFDLLVCSYGLLQQEEVAEMLAKVQWQTVVLDEAQSIKNFATKRSQAAMNLQSGFKLITTGTPIENHLGELWNLFRFINPGLLGSLDSFNEKFANPIERYGDRAARNRLKKLIQPFILRRTKSQVLDELPSRTEILLQVELSSEEMAFYEALRREAIAKLSDSDATAGAKHLQVLAEIMRLRRACCNAQLVRPEMELPSAKLQLFGEVLGELLDNNHKALVFSQFVDHLNLIRKNLDEKQIRYQYLDGSTPAAERKKRVDAFQSGIGDVFLISLKAGGTGLNLTAADYVIHMDPWWNPAVEDQASDRAHRIGQQRPVTIYRLVAKHTIEEKIVDLHRHKRDLADSLLEGSEMSGKVSTDDLLRLINEG